MSAADIEGLPSYPTEEGSGRGITLLTSPMSCTLPFVAFPVCVFHFDRFLQQGKPVSGRFPKNTQTLTVAPQAAAIASITSRKLSLATPTNHQAAQVQYELGQTKYV